MMAITQDQETLQVLGAMAMMNMEGEGIGEVRGYFRKRLIRMGVVKPTDEEAKELTQEAANMPPDPNAEFLKASADQASAEAVKARADTVLTITKARESEAKTMETLAGIELDQRAQLMQAAETLGQPSTMG
jgi:ABC-type Na+ efflux pump permease subunit